MKLLTTIPLRRDGTVTVQVPLGRGKTWVYTFSGEPAACEVEDEDHANWLLSRPHFFTEEDFEKEVEFQARLAERQAKEAMVRKQASAAAQKAGTFDPLDPLPDDLPSDPNSAPEEAGTKPTGRVRKAK